MEQRCPKCRKFGMKRMLINGKYGFMCMWLDCLYFLEDLKKEVSDDK